MRRLRRKKRPTVTREEFLRIKPLRNPGLGWEVREGGEVVVSIPRKKGRFIDFLSKFISAPKEKRIILDKVGSHVWRLCDGKHTAREIAETLHKEYKLTLEEAEASLNAYFAQLSKRGMLGFLLPSEVQARLREEMKAGKRRGLFRL